MSILLNSIFIGSILFFLFASLFHKDILKRHRHLNSCFDIFMMALGYYWESKGLLFLIVSSIVCICAFFCIFYFRVFKKNDYNNANNIVPKNGIKTYLSILLFIVPMAVKYDVIMLGLLIIYIIADRFLFFRKYSTLV